MRRAVLRGGRAGGRRGVFTARQQRLWEEERAFLGALPSLFGEAGATAAEQAGLAGARRQLEELFLVVVVGEFNSGKSTLINALLGERVLADGVTPTTSRINIVKHGRPGADYAEQDAEYARQDIVVVRHAAEWLREINVVDTPGTNAVFSQHQQLTEDFLPRSDLVVFVTSADRPFSASERHILQLIEGWKRKLVLVINKAELLETPEELAKVESFVAAQTMQLGTSGEQVPQFSVAARRALRGQGDAGFEKFREYVTHALTAGERASIKLRGPVSLAGRMARALATRTEERRAIVGEDARALDSLAEESSLWRQSLSGELAMQQSALANILLRLESRAAAFLDETVALSNLPELLMKRASTRERFESRVVGELGRDVERQLASTVDWLAQRSAHRIEQEAQALAKRMHKGVTDGSRGMPADVWEKERAELASTVAESARRALESVDATKEGQQLAEGLRSAAMQVAALELGALGLAGVLSVALMDVTGILGVSAVAGLGLGVLPYRKRQQKARLARLLSDLRARLRDDLQSHFDRHMAALESHLATARQPYKLYVASSSKSLDDVHKRLLDAAGTADKFQLAIEKM